MLSRGVLIRNIHKNRCTEVYRSGKHLQNQAFAQYTCTCTEACRDLYQEPLAFARG